MELIVYNSRYAANNIIDDFLDNIYQSNMRLLASDLFVYDITPEEIKKAIKKAILATEKAGINSKKHFKPIISVKKGESFLDCRLTKTGYTMVLLNIVSSSKYIADFQIKVARQISNLT